MLATLLILLAGLAALAAYFLLRFRRLATDQNWKRVFNALALPNILDDRFDRSETATLPSPAARYLAHAIAPGTPLSQMVDLHASGRIRSRPGDDWLNFEARGRVCAGRGFLWQARIEAIGRFSIEGADYFLDGLGRSDYFLADFIPVVRAGGSDENRSAVSRLLLESVWLPASLLPSRGAVWAAGDDTRTSVRLPEHPDPSSLNLSVTEEGELREASLMRYQGGEAGMPGLTPFGIRVESEAVFAGYRVPSRIAASWGHGTDDAFEFLQLDIDNALYY